MNSILIVFIDGVGIGKKDKENNPFFKYGFDTFQTLFGKIPSLENRILFGENKYLFPSDANLDTPGLPQSGTGQASLFCGYNAARSIGKHFGPFPYTTTLPQIKDEHILVHYYKNKKNGYFVNAYPKPFFDYLRSGRERLGVTAAACLLNKIKFNTVSDVRKGTALTAEAINDRWNIRLNYSLPKIRPQTAARRLLRIAANIKFTLYEFYLLDHLGHLRIKDEFEILYNTIDLFLFTILTEYDPKKTTIIICSDHGNFEDLSVKTHTRNPSLTITAGKFAEEIFKSVKSIIDIKPAIIKYCR